MPKFHFLIIRLLFIMVLSCAVTPTFSQQPVIRIVDRSTLLQQIFTKIKQNSVFRLRVNWDDLHQKVFNDSTQIINEVDFKNKVKLIFETIGDKHGAFFYKGERLGMDRAWVKKLRVPDNLPDTIKLRTALLESGYGYILLPPTSKHDKQTCQRYQDSLCSLGLENLKGLIVDIRLQEGGSIYPLFAGLNQLYGLEYFGSNMDLDGRVHQKWRVYNGGYGKIQVNNHCKVNSELKIVLLTSQITASAGEMMAVALKGRPNTLFVGEPTLGLTTMNVSFDLSSYQLAIAASIIADRRGRVYNNNVLPDITIINGDNFKDLLKDAKVIAALKWMKN